MKPMLFPDGTRLTLDEIAVCIEPWNEEEFKRAALATGYSEKQITKILRRHLPWWRWFV